MKKKTTQEFIKEANSIHNNEYDYSKVQYKGATTKVCIICPKHGEFWQTPTNHIHKTQPQGCPKCKSSKMENSVRKFLEEHNILFEEQKDSIGLVYNHWIFIFHQRTLRLNVKENSILSQLMFLVGVRR
jgi:hypothetical protein